MAYDSSGNFVPDPPSGNPPPGGGSGGNETPSPAALDYFQTLRELLRVGDASESNPFSDLTEDQFTKFTTRLQTQMAAGKWRPPKDWREQLDMAAFLSDLGGDSESVLTVVGGTIQQGFRNPNFSLMNSLWNPYDQKKWGYSFSNPSA
jgi:hypothetical protein